MSSYVDIYSDDFCHNLFESKHHFFITEREFCAGGMNEKDVGGDCQIERGAPLICINSENEPVVYGIASRTTNQHEHCGNSRNPMIMTKVSSLIKWMYWTIIEYEYSPHYESDIYSGEFKPIYDDF